MLFLFLLVDLFSLIHHGLFLLLSFQFSVLLCLVPLFLSSGFFDEIFRPFELSSQRRTDEKNPPFKLVQKYFVFRRELDFFGFLLFLHLLRLLFLLWLWLILRVSEGNHADRDLKTLVCGNRIQAHVNLDSLPVFLDKIMLLLKGTLLC